MKIYKLTSFFNGHINFNWFIKSNISNKYPIVYISKQFNAGKSMYLLNTLNRMDLS